MGYTAIVDYGVGNLKSVTNALCYVGVSTQVTGEAAVLERADAILLPGVGAFPDAAERLRESGLGRVLLEQAGRKPLLGICLGMQLLFERGEEVKNCEGLGLVGGCVRKIETEYKLPHIGWNQLSFHQGSPLFAGVEAGSCVYFVHPFCGVEACPQQVIATTDYGATVVAAVQNGNVYGCQFHPEKSGETGLQILKNFGGLNR